MNANGNGNGNSSGGLVTVAKTPAAKALVTRMDSMLQAFPDGRDQARARFAQIAISMANNMELAQKCDPASLVMAIYGCAQLGLVPDTSLGHIYVVPHKGKATLIPGYRGMIELAKRSGDVSTVYAYVVRENDDFAQQWGTDPRIDHKPAYGNRGALTHAYAVAVHRDGQKQFIVLDAQDIARIKKSSQSAGSEYSPWRTAEDQMWMKSAVRQLCKYLRLSPEAARAIQWDEQADRGEQQTIDADFTVVTEDEKPPTDDALTEMTGEGPPDDCGDDTPHPDPPDSDGMTRPGEFADLPD